MEVKELMSAPPVFVYDLTPLWRAARTVRIHNFGFLPVVSRGYPVGVVTTRDLALQHDPETGLLCTTPVKDVMSSPAIGISWHAPPLEALELMRNFRIHRIVVTDDRGILRGVLSMADIARVIPPENLSKAICRTEFGDGTSRHAYSMPQPAQATSPTLAERT